MTDIFTEINDQKRMDGHQENTPMSATSAGDSSPEINEQALVLIVPTVSQEQTNDP